MMPYDIHMCGKCLQIRKLAILKPNSHAETDVALPNYGCVTSIMIVAMIPMSQLTCVDNETVLPDGNVAQASLITGTVESSLYLI